MAAAAREEKQKQAYEGMGVGGKFRKTPFRRTSHSTPYDRPPTSLRNPNTANDGWLSKLVDPAQRLISSSAHRLFSSVFRKRLPPPQSPSTGVNHEVRIKGKEDVTMYPPGVQKVTVDQSAGPSTTADGGEFTELKQILEQKTFTRSEIDRLTALLHSRTVDIPIENQEKRSEVVPSNPVVSHDRKEEFLKTPVQDKNGIERRLVSNPVVNTSVLHEDVASPAELAKAYMGSRPSKVSPSMLGLRGQAHHEDSPILSSLPIPSKSPMMSLVPWTSGNGEPQENGFVTPRLRGRSAIYSMARTPYSRVRTTTTFKGAGSTVDAYGGALSSQSVSEQSQPSGSKQGVLKRRFSVLDNDIGSVGPIHRIRQKPNLLSSRGLSSPVYSTTSSIRGTRISSEAAQNPSSSIWKPLSLGEPKHKGLAENGDNAVPSTSFSTVPSKSSAMASKILEQLDKFVSPKEKSSETNLRAVRDKLPTKLSPSMLRGQALKSLEDVDSSKFMDNVHNNKSNSKLNVSFQRLIPDARDFTSENEDKVKENGPLTIRAPCDSSAVLMNGEDFTREKKDTVPNVKTAVPTASNAVVHPPQKKQAFRMSAHEDYLELDDDDNSKVENFPTEKSSIATATVTLEKPPAVLADNGTNTVGSSASSYSKLVSTQPSFTYDKVGPPEESNVGPSMFNFGGKVTSVKDLDAASPVFNYVSKSVDEVAQPLFAFASSPTVGESVDVKSGAFSAPKPESSSSVSAVVAAATNSVLKPLESDKADNKDNAGVSFRIPETALSSVSTAPSTTGIFSNGTSYNNSSLNNGSSPPFSPSVPSAFLTSPNSSGSMNLTANTNSGNIASATAVTTESCNVSSSAPAPSFSPVPNFKVESSTASTAVTTNSSNVSSSNPAPSLPAAPILFESPTASIAVTPVPVNSSSVEGKNKEDKGFGNLSSTSFGATSAAIPSTGSGMFGFASGGAATASAANQSQGTRFGADGGSVPISQQTGIASSAATSSFGLSGSTGQFGSISAPNLFGSGASTGLGSSAPPLEANSSSSTAPGISGTSWPSPKFPAFPSTTSLSAGLSYGASLPTSAPTAFGGSSTAAGLSAGLSYGASLATSAPTAFGGSSTAATTSNVPFVFGGSSTAATTNSAPMAFGASVGSSTNTNGPSMMFGSSNGASSTLMFPFTSSAASTAPSQPAVGNPNPAFSFGSLGNNDQMNFVDSMAEDTNQASMSTPPVFGQQHVFGQQPVSNPESGYVFGSTPAVPAANPYQFSSQQNLANPQNPSPFYASGSLGATQGGSFSLGAGDKSNRRMVKVKHNRPRKK